MPRVDVKRIRRRAVSPELALIDPELARAERARLDERAKLDAYKNAPRRYPRVDVERLRRAVASAEDEERARRRRGNQAGGPKWLRRLTLLGGTALVVGGLVAVLTHGRDDRTASSPTRPPVVVATTTTPTATPRVSANANKDAGALPLARRLELRILKLVDAAPRSKLPRQLVDPQTNVVRTDLRATCRRSGVRAFTCIVGSQQRPSDEGLHVLYRLRPGGAGTFAWLGYR